MRYSNRNMALLVFAFRKTNRKEETFEKGKLQKKMRRNNVLGVDANKVDLSEMAFWKKLQNTICVRKVGKRAFSSTLSVL